MRGAPRRLAGMRFTTFLIIVFVLCGTGRRGYAQDEIPKAVLNFYGPDEQRQELNPNAPAETKQFGQFDGIWYCTEQMPDPDTGELKETSTAYWAWKYILGGYGVQDFHYQGKNESPFWIYFKRDLILTQIRIYDPREEVWKVAFINNHAGQGPARVFGRFTAYGDGDDVIMDWDPQDPANLKRITFYDIERESFEWKVENSVDEGKTWKLLSRISAKRLQ